MPFFGFKSTQDQQLSGSGGGSSVKQVAPAPPPPALGQKSRLGKIEAIDLEITVLQAQGLAAKDRNLFGKLVSSDPFVKVILAQELPPDPSAATGHFRDNLRALGHRLSMRDISNNSNSNSSPEFQTLTLKLGKTDTVYKTLNPVWNDTIYGSLKGQQSLQHHTPHKHPARLEFHIFDEDQLSRSDSLGVVTVPIPTEPRPTDFTQWYNVPPDSARHAQGRIQIRIRTFIHRSHILVRGNTFTLSKYNQTSKHRTKQTIQLGLSWDVVPKQPHLNRNNTSNSNASNGAFGLTSAQEDEQQQQQQQQQEEEGVDLDVACVAVSHEGYVIMPDTVYYGNLANSNRSVLHSGDEQEGKLKGDDESITLQLDKIPNHVLAMYIILTVATPNMALSDVQSTRVRVKDITPMDEDVPPTSFRQEQTLCTFTPSTHTDSEDATAMFMVRIARDQTAVPKGKVSKKWALTPMEDTHPTARDFGTLIPHIKSYTRDLVPNLKVDPTERVAILRKGGNIRVQDYCPQNKLPEKVTFGLAWDVTDGEDIDLDASAICLDANLNLVDMVWWKQLHSKDYNIVHHGDEREGDQVGDDELIDLHLNNMSMMGEHCHVQYIGFVINSYSGQKLKDVDRASCHLFDPDTNIEMATYALTNARELEGVSALLVACLYRVKPNYDQGMGPVIETIPKKNAKEGEWCLSVISEKCDGRTVKDNVEDFREYLRMNPLQPAVIDDSTEDHGKFIQAEMPPPVPLAADDDEDIDETKSHLSFSTPIPRHTTTSSVSAQSRDDSSKPHTASSSVSIAMSEEEKRRQFDSQIAEEEGIHRRHPVKQAPIVATEVEEKRTHVDSSRGGTTGERRPVTPLSNRKSPSVIEQDKRAQFDFEIEADEGIKPATSPIVTSPTLNDTDKRTRFDFEIAAEGGNVPPQRGLKRS